MKVMQEIIYTKRIDSKGVNKLESGGVYTHTSMKMKGEQGVYEMFILIKKQRCFHLQQRPQQQHWPRSAPSLLLCATAKDAARVQQQVVDGHD